MRNSFGWSREIAKQRVSFALLALFAAIIFSTMVSRASSTSVTITTDLLPSGKFQTNYNGGLSASGGTLPYSYTSTGLPQGLFLNASSGVISGQPLQAGSFTVTVTAIDSMSSASTPKTITLTVAPPTVIVTTASLAGGTFLAPYSATSLNASGGAGPYGFAATGLPRGLSVTGGMISGTPTQAGTFTVTIIATDGTPSANGGPFKSVPQPLTMTVAPPTVTVAISSLRSGTKGTSYGAPLGGSGGAGPYSYTATGLPPGLSVTGGAISGTPTQSGNFAVSIIATDSTSSANGGPFKSATKSFLLVITAVRPASA